jgi:hypothetical protein
MQRLVFVYGINDLTVFHHDSVSQLAGGLQVPACGHRQAAALGRFADFFAKGSNSDPDGNPRWGTGGYVFAPRHGPLVWHSSLKRCTAKPINKTEVLKAENRNHKVK